LELSLQVCYCITIFLRLLLLKMFTNLVYNASLNSIITSFVDIYVIEFQKGGLPHTHILLTLAHGDKPSCAEEIDSFICVELPEQDLDPLAYAIVARHMIHGPCGPGIPHVPCMEVADCSKHYPKSFFMKHLLRRMGLSSTCGGMMVEKSS